MLLTIPLITKSMKFKRLYLNCKMLKIHISKKKRSLKKSRKWALKHKKIFLNNQVNKQRHITIMRLRLLKQIISLPGHRLRETSTPSKVTYSTIQPIICTGIWTYLRKRILKKDSSSPKKLWNHYFREIKNWKTELSKKSKRPPQQAMRAENANNVLALETWRIKLKNWLNNSPKKNRNSKIEVKLASKNQNRLKYILKQDLKKLWKKPNDTMSLM